MSRYQWPASLLEDFKVPGETIGFFQSIWQESEEKSKKLEDLYNEHQLLKDTSAKQERYIAELEKQIGILQKTLDLVDRNKPRFIVKPKVASEADLAAIPNGPVILCAEDESIIPINPDQWIPVTERVPGFDIERVLVMLCGDHVIGYPKMDTDRFVNEKWVRYGDNVSHWMHLPDAPKDGD